MPLSVPGLLGAVEPASTGRPAVHVAGQAPRANAVRVVDRVAVAEDEVLAAVLALGREPERPLRVAVGGATGLEAEPGEAGVELAIRAVRQVGKAVVDAQRRVRTEAARVEAAVDREPRGRPAAVDAAGAGVGRLGVEVRVEDEVGGPAVGPVVGAVAG